MGVPIPPEAVKVIDIVNKVSVVLKKLNLTLKIEGGAVVGTRMSPLFLADLEFDFTGEVYNYPWSSMKVLDKSSCPV
jgi:hypothetical protein